MMMLRGDDVTVIKNRIIGRHFKGHISSAERQSAPIVHSSSSHEGSNRPFCKARALPCSGGRWTALARSAIFLLRAVLVWGMKLSRNACAVRLKQSATASVLGA